MGIERSGYGFKVPAHQADATLSQAAPVQNTYYTILDTSKNVKVYIIACSVADTGETLQVTITIDGQTYTGSQAAVAGTLYSCFIGRDGAIGFASGNQNVALYAPLTARSLKVQIKKTTAAGAGTITGRVIYAKW